MTELRDEKVLNRVYKIWEQNGRSEGRKDEFWHQAQQELRNEDKSSPLRTPDTL